MLGLLGPRQLVRLQRVRHRRERWPRGGHINHKKSILISRSTRGPCRTGGGGAAASCRVAGGGAAASCRIACSGVGTELMRQVGRPHPWRIRGR